MGKRGMTIEEVAERCDVNYDTVHRWVRVGYQGIVLAATKSGRRWKVMEEDLERFQKECRAASIVEDVPETKRPRRRRDSRSMERRIEEMRRRLDERGI